MHEVRNKQEHVRTIVSCCFEPSQPLDNLILYTWEDTRTCQKNQITLLCPQLRQETTCQGKTTSPYTPGQEKVFQWCTGADLCSFHTLQARPGQQKVLQSSVQFTLYTSGKEKALQWGRGAELCSFHTLQARPAKYSSWVQGQTSVHFTLYSPGKQKVLKWGTGAELCGKSMGLNRVLENGFQQISQSCNIARIACW